MDSDHFPHRIDPEGAPSSDGIRKDISSQETSYDSDFGIEEEAAQGFFSSDPDYGEPVPDGGFEYGVSAVGGPEYVEEPDPVDSCMGDMPV